MKAPSKLCCFGFAIVLSSSIALAGPQTDAASAPAGQEEYRPQFAGDPARSRSEALALGYMRVVLRAEQIYKQKNGKYAPALLKLVNTGTFTKRMISPERGDYKVRFRGTGESFALWMDALPQPSAQHRSFFADQRGTIRAEEAKSAGPESLEATNREPPARGWLATILCRALAP
jgi:hypothetical protein